MKEVEIIAKTKEEAAAMAMQKLGVSQLTDLEITVLEEGSKGFLGLIGSKDYRIKASRKDDPKQRARDFLSQIYACLDMNVDTYINKEESLLHIDIKGEEAGRLIGRRGEALDALQLITGIAVNNKDDEFVRVQMDIENYRQKREESLIHYAQKMANKAIRQKRNIRLEPMSPNERRIVHSALQDMEKISTYSEGRDPYRRVIISHKIKQKTSAVQ